MNTPDSQQIVARFFQALYHLKSLKVIRGKQTFTRENNIDRWTMNNVEKDMASDMFQPAWLAPLVLKYGVSAKWLLTGIGDIMEKKPRK